MWFGAVCSGAPVRLAAGHRSILLEAHMDDMHGGGSDAEMPGFLEQLQEKVMLIIKLHYVAGESYDHLKRHRRRTHE